MNGRRSRHWAALTIALCLSVSSSNHGGAQEVVDVLRFGMTTRVIEGASAADARSASMLWSDGVARAIGLFRSTESIVYSELDDAVRALADRTVHVLALSSMEYLATERTIKCVPELVYEVSGEVMRDYVLIARQRPASAAAFAGKTLMAYSPNREQSLSTVWLDTYLRDAGLKQGLNSFPTVRYADKRGQGVMAVFFKQVDLAVESASAFATAASLNPQIGREVVVLAKSPLLLPGLACMSDAMPASVREAYVERSTRLHEQLRYRQAFMVLRVTRLVAFKPEYLDSARALLARQRSGTPRRQ